MAASLAGKPRGPDKSVFFEGYSVLRVSPEYIDDKISPSTPCTMSVPVPCAEVFMRDYRAAQDFRVVVDLAKSQVLSVSAEPSEGGAIPEEIALARQIAEGDLRVQEFVARGARVDNVAGVLSSERRARDHVYSALIYFSGDRLTAWEVVVDLTDRQVVKINSYP